MNDLKTPACRADAKALQAVRYYTGKPCLRGHLSERFTSTGQCLECIKAQNADWCKRNHEKVASAQKAWRDRQPKPKKTPTVTMTGQERNRRYRLRKRGYPNANPDIQCIPLGSKTRWAIYSESKKTAIAKTQKLYRQRNHDALKAAWQAWYSANRVSQVEKATMRRKKVMRATPPWLTAEDRAKISATYFLAVETADVTGVDHHVDHIVPIAGRTVCGLHVPWNLRVIPAAENLSKSNKLLDI